MLDKICTPAVVYLFLSILSILFAIYNNVGMLTILVKWIFTMLWTWVLNYICSSGYPTVAWVLVLLPFIILVLLILVAVEVTLLSGPGNPSLTALPSN